MKIMAAKTDLEAALQVTTIGVSSSGSDLSTHLVFRIRNGQMEMLSGDLRICTLATVAGCKYEGDDGEAMTVEGWRLKDWLRAVGDVAVELEQQDKGTVKARAPRSTITLASLDAIKFPWWDKTFAEAKESITISSARLSSALDYIRHFIPDVDTTEPDIAQTEVLDGRLWATDKKAVSVVTVPGIDKASFRVNGKDIPALVKFFSLSDTNDVKVLEHERGVYFVRDDGALIGASRPIPAFPTLKVDLNAENDGQWEVRSAELLQGIECLNSAAEKDNKSMRFAFDADNNRVVLSVASAAGGRDEFLIDAVSHEKVDPFYAQGFELAFSYVRDVVGHFGGDTLVFGLKKQAKGGYVQFRHKQDGDEYLTVAVWRI